MQALLLKFAGPIAGFAVLMTMANAGLGWLLLKSHEENGELRQSLKTQAAETREAADANDSNLATIASLKGTIASMINDRRAEEARTRAELEAREHAAMLAREEADRLRSERDALIRDDPTCQAHSRQVLADSCPALADRLRERSRGSGRHPD